MIVAKSTDKPTRKLLARALMSPDGLTHLEEQLPDSARPRLTNPRPRLTNPQPRPDEPSPEPPALNLSPQQP